MVKCHFNKENTYFPGALTVAEYPTLQQEETQDADKCQTDFLGAKRPLEPLSLLISAVLAAPHSQQLRSAQSHQLSAADWPMTNTSGTAGAEKLQQMPLFLLSPNPPLQAGWDFSPEGSMPAPGTPQPGVSVAYLTQKWAFGQAGEVKGGPVLLGRVGLWPCRTAPCFLSSGHNSAYVNCINLKYSANSFLHGRPWHNDAIHTLCCGVTESLDRGVRTCSSFAKHAFKYLF